MLPDTLPLFGLVFAFFLHLSPVLGGSWKFKGIDGVRLQIEPKASINGYYQWVCSENRRNQKELQEKTTLEKTIDECELGCRCNILGQNLLSPIPDGNCDDEIKLAKCWEYDATILVDSGFRFTDLL